MPTLNRPQKLFLAAVGVIILAFQLYRFSEHGVEGTGWILAFVTAALLILPALSLLPSRSGSTATPPSSAKSSASALLDPDSRAQRLYRAVLGSAEQIADSIPNWMGLPPISVPGLPSLDDMRSHWLHFCIPYTACLMFAGQIRRDINFNRSPEFVVIYGQSVQRMIELSQKVAKDIGEDDKFDGGRVEQIAKQDFAEAEAALLHFIDAVAAKRPEADSQLLNYLTMKIGVPETLQSKFQDSLRAYTKSRMSEFSRL